MKIRNTPCILLLITLVCAASAPAQRTKSKVSPTPLTAEQLAVYRVVLHGWMENDVPAINLSGTTIQLETGGLMSDEGCAKGLDMEPASPSIVHRFRTEDLAHLGSGKIILVDEERQSKEVAENDPERGMGRGKSVDEAVRNGFNHGLVTLSEIHFDKAHNHAVVAYGFRCGGLCGNGGTWILEKQDNVWVRKTRCQEWISTIVLPVQSGAPGLDFETGDTTTLMDEFGFHLEPGEWPQISSSQLQAVPQDLRTMNYEL